MPREKRRYCTLQEAILLDENDLPVWMEDSTESVSERFSFERYMLEQDARTDWTDLYIEPEDDYGDDPDGL